MAFKRSKARQDIFENPIELFRSFSKRKFPTEMPHQRTIIETYMEQALKKPDVALQLPTGSGKTLVGATIGEWRRRKFDERVVYLCPTRQLVNQTVRQCRDHYGMDALGFTGKKREYAPGDVAEYRQGRKIAVTTYQSVFNVNPFFHDADTIIIDDAHAAENYIGNMWSVEIDASEEAHRALHQSLANILKPHIGRLDYSILTGDVKSFADTGWVEKIPSPVLSQIHDAFVEVCDEYTAETNLRYPWNLIRDHLPACHVYMSYRGFLIRPLIPPTWTLDAFEDAGHRIYMSATLGEGGDLERLTGRENIYRLAAPEGHNLETVGRRFFMFPGMSLQDEDITDLRNSLIEKSGRAVILTPSKKAANQVVEEINEVPNLSIFSAADIEESKDSFVKSERAVAVMAGRYDGIDFPNDECRLLCVEDLPKAANLQERFIATKMGAELLLNTRIQTRVLQAIGRCTRSLQDYSAIFITGSELQDYLSDKKKRAHLLPEFQAELAFGVEQSLNVELDDFLDNFDVFIENGDDWRDVETDIVTDTKSMHRKPFPASEELEAAVSLEVKYQKSLWASDYDGALKNAKAVLEQLKSPELRGYRALWHYLSGAAALHLSRQGNTSAGGVAKDQFRAAIKAANELPWTSSLLLPDEVNEILSAEDRELSSQVEKIEAKLLSLGTTQDRKFSKLEKEILEGLQDKDRFEQAQVELGRLLGFSCGNSETDAAPDPWWLCEGHGVVFEDYVGAEQDSLGADKARQAASHPVWLEEKVETAKGCDIMSIIVAPVTKAHDGAFPHLANVGFWNVDEFRKWAVHALGVMRELKRTLPNGSDLAWRAQAAKVLVDEKLTMELIRQVRSETIAKDALKPL
ncbi:DEAD/DEAH box helicase [Mesobaculum littorinae]|uniref:DEAD/DEAH box helicase n=1 Tax=Mesobaculum littorinae TaxID=2486419 RepID=A0A438ACX4_9RHOB|nr:DEAD/DEAH box helicase [Mesobaculum littorinae]RVV96525.1 DEAD/DEAH box helicase [Mesobaculum littorinae]